MGGRVCAQRPSFISTMGAWGILSLRLLTKLRLEKLKMAATANRYHLGASNDELARLAYQHQVWLDVAVELWHAAAFSRGQHLVDLGCGPGFAAVDLARLVGPAGHIDAVDSSDRFLQALKTRCEAEQLSHVKIHLSEASSLSLSDSSVDGVFARWLLCFVGDPARVISEAKRILRPGMPLVLLDYFNYRAASVYPARDSFRMLFEAYHASARANAGSYDIGEKLPSILSDQGFKLSVLKPICRVARPGTPTWHWIELFNKNYIPKLVEQGLMTVESRQVFEADWEEASRNPASFFFTPPMLGIVAHKST